MIAVCSRCGKNYEAGSEEQANEPGCLCRPCFESGVCACGTPLPESCAASFTGPDVNRPSTHEACGSGSADQTTFIVEGHPQISAKYRVKRLGCDAPYTEWGTYDQADRDRDMLTLGWRACAEANAEQRNRHLQQIDDLSRQLAGDDEDRCGHCGRRCPNSLCDRCKMDLDRSHTGMTDDERGWR